MKEIEINIPVKIKVGNEIDVISIIEQITAQKLDKKAVKEVIEHLDQEKTSDQAGKKHEKKRTIMPDPEQGLLKSQLILGE